MGDFGVKNRKTIVMTKYLVLVPVALVVIMLVAGSCIASDAEKNKVEAWIYFGGLEINDDLVSPYVVPTADVQNRVRYAYMALGFAWYLMILTVVVWITWGIMDYATKEKVGALLSVKNPAPVLGLPCDEDTQVEILMKRAYPLGVEALIARAKSRGKEVKCLQYDIGIGNHLISEEQAAIYGWPQNVEEDSKSLVLSYC